MNGWTLWLCLPDGRYDGMASMEERREVVTLLAEFNLRRSIGMTGAEH